MGGMMGTMRMMGMGWPGRGSRIFAGAVSYCRGGTILRTPMGGMTGTMGRGWPVRGSRIFAGAVSYI